MATALVTQIAYAVQTLFDPAGTAGRLVDLGKLANYGLLTSFTPAALFTTGVNGAWYDPSDFSTMFQDAAGTTPVTAVGQPVGLMLDKSKGLVLGPELVTNGDFSQGATGWTLTSGWSVTGGSLVLVSTGTSFPQAFQSVTSGVSGKWVTISGQYSGLTSGKTARIALYSGTSDVVGQTLSASSGNFSMRAYCPTGVSYTLICLIPSATSVGDTVAFDNISVRELPGNHAFNPSGNSANFPVLSARYNLLTYSEDFSNAVWSLSGTASKASSKEVNLPATNDRILNAATYVSQVNESITASIGLTGSGTITIGVDSSGGVYESGAQQITLSSTPTIFTVSKTFVQTGHVQIRFFIIKAAGDTATSVTLTRGADLRVSNDALNQPAYQRVNTASDYDTVGFNPYLAFNGVNQWLQTNSIDFTYGDKMFVAAGVRKLSDAAVGVAVELSAAAGVYPGIFIAAPKTSSGSDYGFRSSGSTAEDATSSSSYAAPITNIVSGIGNIGAPSSILRINGTQSASNTSTQGTGNYGNYPMYIGARAGTSLYFNGRLYGLVVAGKQASASEVASTESWLNQKTGAY